MLERGERLFSFLFFLALGDNLSKVPEKDPQEPRS